MPETEKDELLARMIAGDTVLANEILQRVRRERADHEHREQAPYGTEAHLQSDGGFYLVAGAAAQE